MQSYLIIDITVALVIILSALFAYSRGFVREILSITSWVLAFLAAFLYAPAGLPVVKSLPYIGGFLNKNCESGILVAFIVIFAVTLFGFSILTSLLAHIVRNSDVSGFDCVMGFVFGALRGTLLAVIFFVIYERFLDDSEFLKFDESRSVKIYNATKDSVGARLPKEVPQWALRNYENLIEQCTAHKLKASKIDKILPETTENTPKNEN